MSPTRRAFLTGAITALAAPAIIRTAGLIMPIRPAPIICPLTFEQYYDRILMPKLSAAAVKMYEDAIIYGVGGLTLPGLTRIDPETLWT